MEHDPGPGRALGHAAGGMAATVLEQALGYLAFVYLSRQLGAEGTGQYASIYAAAGVALALAHDGLGSYLVRETAQDPDGAAVFGANALALKGALAALSVAGAILWFATRGLPGPLLAAAVLAALTQLSTALGSVPAQLLNARERIGAVIGPRLLERTLACTLIVGALAAGGGLVHVALALAVAAVVRDGLYFVLLARVAPLRFELSRATIRRQLVESLPFGLTLFFLVLHHRADAVMVWRLAGDLPAGLYGAAYRILDALNALGIVVQLVAYPRLCRASAEDASSFQAVSKFTLRAVLVVACPVACGVWLIAPALVRALYGEAFAAAAPLVRILAGTQLALLLNNALSLVAYARGRQGPLTALTAAAAAANILANAVAIPAYGAAGAAWVSLATQGAFTAALAAMLGRDAVGLVEPGLLWRAGVGALAMAALVSGLAPDGLAAPIALGVVSYTLWQLAFRTPAWVQSP